MTNWHLFKADIKPAVIGYIGLFVPIMVFRRCGLYVLVAGVYGGQTESQSKPYTPRRAVMYVPGNDQKKIQKATSLDLDCAVLDCEDGVAANKKVRILLIKSRIKIEGQYMHHVFLIWTSRIQYTIDPFTITAVRLSRRANSYTLPKF